MMTGYAEGLYKPQPKARKYRVVANAGGWSVALGEACTFPFKDRAQAQSIARELQKQADALSGHPIIPHARFRTEQPSSPAIIATAAAETAT